MTEAAFYIRDLPVRGELILAPLSGYNDQPFRRLCREMGAALVVTGLLSSRAIIYNWEGQRSKRMLRFHPDERPLAAQLYGSEPEEIAEAARRIAPLDIDVIDVNLGCAKAKIVKNDNGAALLQHPAKIGRIIAALTRAVELPITAKIRLGWEARNYLEVARVLEASGAAAIAVHGRTAAQGFKGAADWDAIAEIKAAVDLPVLASGDVKEAADIARIQAHTGCDGVMIGRAALGHPWIFQRRDRAAIPPEERFALMRRHLQMMLAFHGRHHGLLRFRKHLSNYLRHADVPRSTRIALLQCDDPPALLNYLRDAS